MTIENKLRTLAFGTALVAAANNAYADNQAQPATAGQFANVLYINGNATNASQANRNDWNKQVELISGNATERATVLIKPVQGQPGFCFYGLDGFPQKYDFPADARTLDGTLEKTEMIVNLSETNPDRMFYFPCDLVAKPETPQVIYVPGPVVPQLVPSQNKPRQRLQLSLAPLGGYSPFVPFDGNITTLHQGYVGLETCLLPTGKFAICLDGRGSFGSSHEYALSDGTPVTSELEVADSKYVSQTTTTEDILGSYKPFIFLGASAKFAVAGNLVNGPSLSVVPGLELSLGNTETTELRSAYNQLYDQNRMAIGQLHQISDSSSTEALTAALYGRLGFRFAYVKGPLGIGFNADALLGSTISDNPIPGIGFVLGVDVPILPFNF